MWGHSLGIQSFTAEKAVRTAHSCGCGSMKLLFHIRRDQETERECKGEKATNPKTLQATTHFLQLDISF